MELHLLEACCIQEHFLQVEIIADASMHWPAGLTFRQAFVHSIPVTQRVLRRFRALAADRRLEPWQERIPEVADYVSSGENTVILNADVGRILQLDVDLDPQSATPPEIAWAEQCVAVRKALAAAEDVKVKTHGTRLSLRQKTAGGSPKVVLEYTPDFPYTGIHVTGSMAQMFGENFVWRNNSTLLKAAEAFISLVVLLAPAYKQIAAAATKLQVSVCHPESKCLLPLTHLHRLPHKSGNVIECVFFLNLRLRAKTVIVSVAMSIDDFQEAPHSVVVVPSDVKFDVTKWLKENSLAKNLLCCLVE